MVTPASEAFWSEEGNARAKLPQSPPIQPRHWSNPTIFSDAEMFSWQPVILIRNPMAVYESWLRAEGTPRPSLDAASSLVYTTMRFQRRIFDWYRQKYDDGKTDLFPIVIDADDILECPESIDRLCHALGMDPGNLVFQWSAEPSSKIGDKTVRTERFLQTLRGSTGIDRSKTSKDFDVVIKEVEWTEMFGRVEASILAARVRESWPDYEHLRAFRLLS
jgi:hypothetical protein